MTGAKRPCPGGHGESAVNCWRCFPPPKIHSKLDLLNVIFYFGDPKSHFVDYFLIISKVKFFLRNLVKLIQHRGIRTKLCGRLHHPCKSRSVYPITHHPGSLRCGPGALPYLSWPLFLAAQLGGRWAAQVLAGDEHIGYAHPFTSLLETEHPKPQTLRCLAIRIRICCNYKIINT